MSISASVDTLYNIYTQIGQLLAGAGYMECTVVCLRQEDKHFRAFPNEGGSTFHTAITALSPQAAITVRTPAVVQLCQSLPNVPGYRVGDLDVPIIDSYNDLFGFGNSRGSALVRQGSMLVVWSDSVQAILTSFRDLEHALRHLAHLCVCSTYIGPAYSSLPPSPAVHMPNPMIFENSEKMLVGRLDRLSGLGTLNTLDYQGGLANVRITANDLSEPSQSDQFNHYVNEQEEMVTDISQLAPYAMGRANPHWVCSPCTSSNGSSPSTLSQLSISPDSVGSDLSPGIYFSPSLMSPHAPLATPLSSLYPFSPMDDFSTFQPDIYLSPDPLTVAPALLSPAPAFVEDDLPNALGLDDNEMIETYAVLEPITSVLVMSPAMSPVHPVPVPIPTPIPFQEEPSEVLSAPRGRKRGRPSKSAATTPASASAALRPIKPRSAPLQVVPLPRSRMSSSNSNPARLCPLPGLRPTKARALVSSSASATPSPCIVGRDDQLQQRDDIVDDDDSVSSGDDEARDEDFDLGGDELDEDEDDENDDYGHAPSPAKRPKTVLHSEVSTIATQPKPKPKTKLSTRGKGRKRTSKAKRQFRCPNCPQTFGRNTDLARHMKRSNCNQVEAPRDQFQCELCPRAFRRKDAFKRHIDSRHKDVRWADVEAQLKSAKTERRGLACIQKAAGFVSDVLDAVESEEHDGCDGDDEWEEQ